MVEAREEIESANRQSGADANSQPCYIFFGFWSRYFWTNDASLPCHVNIKGKRWNCCIIIWDCQDFVLSRNAPNRTWRSSRVLLPKAAANKSGIISYCDRNDLSCATIRS